MSKEKAAVRRKRKQENNLGVWELTLEWWSISYDLMTGSPDPRLPRRRGEEETHSFPLPSPSSSEKVEGAGFPLSYY